MRPVCANALLTRDPGCDEIRPPHLRRVARRQAGSRAGRASTTFDARRSEGNHQSYIEDLEKRKGPDADQPHRIAYEKLVRA